jgi:PST family polysaccharide transporter
VNGAEERRVWGNTLLLSGGEAVGQVANFLFVVLVARTFGPELLGVYALAMAVGSVLCILVSFGSISLLTRTIGESAERGSRARAVLAPVHMMMALAVGGLATAVSFGAAQQNETAVVLSTVIAYQILVRLTAIQLTEARGRERMRIVAVLTAVRRMAILAAALTAHWLWPAHIGMMFALPLTALAVLAAAVLATRRMEGYSTLLWRPREAREWMGRCRPFLSLVVLSTAYDRLGILLLSALAGAAAAGTFLSGERVVTALHLFSAMLAGAALPALSRLQERDSERAELLATRCLRLLLLVTAPLAAILSLVSEDLIVLVFGEGYRAAAAVLAVVSWVLITRGILVVFQARAVAAFHQRTAVTSRAVGVAAILVVAPVLIMALGPLGLAAAVVVAELLQVGVLGLSLRRAGLNPALPGLLSVIATVSLVAAFDLLVSDQTLLLRLPMLAMAAAVGVFLFRGVRREDLSWTIRLVRGEASLPK